MLLRLAINLPIHSSGTAAYLLPFVDIRQIAAFMEDFREVHTLRLSVGRNLKKLVLFLVGGKRNLELINKLKEKWVFLWLSSIRGSRVLVRLHFALFSDAFEREAKAVLEGRIAARVNQSGTEHVNYFLRRAVHRLEKGLIMKPRRAVYGLDYILEAVEAYVKSVNLQGRDTPELLWAQDVFEVYFATVEDHPVVNRARSIFETSKSRSIRESAMVPYPAGKLRKSKITRNDLMQLAMQRRSVRWYQQRPVPRAIIDGCLEVALQAPSACNRQPYRFLVYDNPEKIREVAKLPMGVAGFAHNFPMLIGVVGQLRAYNHSRDRHAIYIDASLAAMSFMYALETEGLSSCPINWPDIKHRELEASRMLNLDGDERIVMFISVGYPEPEGNIPFSQKVFVNQVTQYNPSLSS